MRCHDIDAWEQCAHMSRVPGDDARNVVCDRSLANKRVVYTWADMICTGKHPHDIERLRRRQAYKPCDGAQALEPPRRRLGYTETVRDRRAV